MWSLKICAEGFEYILENPWFFAIWTSMNLVVHLRMCKHPLLTLLTSQNYAVCHSLRSTCGGACKVAKSMRQVTWGISARHNAKKCHHFSSLFAWGGTVKASVISAFSLSLFQQTGILFIFVATALSHVVCRAYWPHSRMGINAATTTRLVWCGVEICCNSIDIHTEGTWSTTVLYL